MLFTNHLINETSPYLHQHVHNPVDWYPWGEESLKKASEDNKPILLSIGYSACHWCHVMAHESFEDEETAALMNQLFVNIKVDREERPDLDKIYQTVHQLLTQNPGGWPLTVFLDPKHHLPFFTGTYFPKEPSYQLPGFKDLLQKVSAFYTQNYQEILNQAPKLIASLQSFSIETASSSNEAMSIAPWHKASKQLSEDYDATNGGFGNYPKFPNPMNLELLMRNVLVCGNKKAIHQSSSFTMLQTTLTQMAHGGIYDQIGGGFYRYSVDARWQIPHFEKMLYDNAQLLHQYVQADVLSPNLFFKQVITETANWVIREAQSPEGGYYSSLDADSEGKEGLYYLWTPEQVKALLTEEEFKLFLLRFNLTEPPNFEHAWHLHITNTIEQISQKCNQSVEKITTILNSAQKKLLQARNHRITPGLDDKILTSWNALMIKGMVLAGVHLAEPTWIDSAEQALRFIYKQLWKNGRLLATYKEQRAHLAAYLDDYAFLLDAILTFLQYRWQTDFLLFAKELAEVLIKHFEDPQGGFYFVANDHEALLYRPKTLTDNVTPAGNGIACYALQRLGYLFAEPRYLAIVEKSLNSAWAAINEHPAAHISLLLTLHDYLEPPQIIVIRGEQDDLASWQNISQKNYSPSRMVFMIPDNETNLPAALADKMPTAKITAYVCQGLQCLPPITKLSDFASLIKRNN